MKYPMSDEAKELVKADMEKSLWDFIDTAAANLEVKPDPRIWGHLLVYAPEEIKDKLRYLWEDTPAKKDEENQK